jgi:hypothetical protein
MVGEAVVGGVAAKVVGNDNVTLPAVAEGAIVPKRISAGSDNDIGGKIVALTGILLVSASELEGGSVNASARPIAPAAAELCPARKAIPFCVRFMARRVSQSSYSPGFMLDT